LSQIVCTYGGRCFRDDDDVPQSNYLLGVKKGLVIDGNPLFPESSGHMGIYINDACGPIKTGDKNNVRFSLGWIQTSDGKKQVIWIRAKKHIAAGDELFLSYGSDFWKKK